MPKKETKSTELYHEGIGRRKTSVARARVYSHKGKGLKEIKVMVNGNPLEEYFFTPRQRKVAVSPFVSIAENHKTTVFVKGGGMESQAEAVRLGISRALVKLDESWKGKFKALGYLTRDPRMVERKKFGSRKARRPQQWRKR